MKLVKTIQLVALAGLLVASTAARATVIDNFDNGGQEVIVVGGGSPGLSQLGPLSGVLGGYRDIYVYDVTGPDYHNATAQAGPGYGQQFSLSTGPGIDSKARIVWDGSGGNGLNVDTTGLGVGGVDLTSGGTAAGIHLKLIGIDTDAELTFTAWYNGGVNQTSMSHVFTTPVSDYFFPFSTAGYPAAFSGVTALKLEISGPTSVDAAFDLIETTPAVADGYSTLALLGLALPAVGAMRRRLA